MKLVLENARNSIHEPLGVLEEISPAGRTPSECEPAWSELARFRFAGRLEYRATADSRSWLFLGGANRPTL